MCVRGLPWSYCFFDYTKLSIHSGNRVVKFLREPFSTEFFSDKQTGSMEPGFDGALAQSEDVAHFFGAQPFHVAQNEDHAILARLFGDGPV